MLTSGSATARKEVSEWLKVRCSYLAQVVGCLRYLRFSRKGAVGGEGFPTLLSVYIVGLFELGFRRDTGFFF